MNAIPWIDDLPKDEVVAIAREEHEELGALRVLHDLDQNEIDRLRAEVERLTAERDAAMADSERIDLVDEQGKRVGWVGWKWEDELGVIISGNRNRWRDTVDAARKVGEER